MRGRSRHLALMGNCPTCSHSLGPINRLFHYQWFVTSLLVRGTIDSVATSNMPLEKKVDMKYMRVNVLKNIARVTRRLCAFIMSHTYFRVNLLCSCVNVKELLARKRRDIWRWSGCHGIQTHNYLASKLAKMVKWLNG